MHLDVRSGCRRGAGWTGCVRAITGREGSVRRGCILVLYYVKVARSAASLCLSPPSHSTYGKAAATRRFCNRGAVCRLESCLA